MKVYVSTGCLRSAPGLFELLAAYRDAGLCAVELGAAALEPGHRDSLVQQLRRERLEFLVHNYFPPPARSFVINLASPDLALRERSLEFAREGLELTAALDAPAYSVHAGFVTDPVGFDGTSLVLPEPASHDAQAEAERRLGDAIAILKERAGELGLRLLVENNVCVPEHRGKLLVQRGGEAAALVRAAGDGVGLLLDTGHVKVSAATLDFDWADFVDETAAFVGGFHLHDNDGSVDTHTPVAPGSWALEVVRRPEFADVPVVVEAKFDSLDELRRHVDWLRHELGAE